MKISEITKENSKQRAKNGGGSGGHKYGLWQSPTKKNQRHIKAAILGIEPEQLVQFSVENNKICFNLVNEKQAAILKKRGISLFKMAKDGRKYHNYIVLDSLPEADWKKFVEINGGVKTYSKNEINPEDLYTVQPLEDD